jgi:hypothetical protein
VKDSAIVAKRRTAFLLDRSRVLFNVERTARELNRILRV